MWNSNIFNKQSTITLIEREIREYKNPSLALQSEACLQKHLESHWFGASLRSIVDMYYFILFYLQTPILVQHPEFSSRTTPPFPLVYILLNEVNSILVPRLDI